MITNFRMKIDFTKDFVGTTVEDTKRAVLKKNSRLKVFIPSLMSKIKKGEPKTENISIYGKSIFVNDSSCRPYVSSNVIKSRNYITISLNDLLDIDKYAVRYKEDGPKYFPVKTKLTIKTPDGDYRNFKCTVR